MGESRERPREPETAPGAASRARAGKKGSGESRAAWAGLCMGASHPIKPPPGAPSPHPNAAAGPRGRHRFPSSTRSSYGVAEGGGTVAAGGGLT